MKRLITSAFTLIEMLIVIVVIVILAALFLAINGLVQKKAALALAQNQIERMRAACESYKGDFGGYPRDIPQSGSRSVTDKLDPRDDGDPRAGGYKDACLYLYKALSGDAKPGTDPTTPAGPNTAPDGKPETKSYCEFELRQLERNKDGDIQYIVDPFGYSYGYSTAGAEADEKYREEVQQNPNAPRTGKFQRGFSPTYDLWSTAGFITEGGNLNDVRKRWIKSW